jgi:hypothetical protein
MLSQKLSKEIAIQTAPETDKGIVYDKIDNSKRFELVRKVKEYIILQKST